MQNHNYFVLLDFPEVKMYGFSHVTDYAFIRILKSKQKFFVDCTPQTERPNCFQITIYKNRTIRNHRLYYLIETFHIEHEHFLYNSFMQNYYPI